MTRLACISVDLDEVHHYADIHGIGRSAAADGHPVYQLAIPRFEELSRALAIPLTFFAVGEDIRREENAAILRRVADRGHEVANHSLEHRYDLTRLPASEMQRQVEQGARVIETATGVRPAGFRAPGYVISDALARVLEDAGVSYDSSVFPCPAYYAAKGAALAWQRFRQRRSASIVDTPKVLLAPATPYRLGRPYHTKGCGLLELPIQVTPGLRLPYIGTSLTLAGVRGARWLTHQVAKRPFVNLELHGIDLLEAADGLESLSHSQPDLRVSVARKRETLAAVAELLKAAGFEFVRLDRASVLLGG